MNLSQLIKSTCSQPKNDCCNNVIKSSKDLEMTFGYMDKYLGTIQQNWQTSYVPWNPNKNKVLIELFDRIEAIQNLM